MGMLDAGDFAGFCLRQQRIGTRRHLTHCRRGSTLMSAHCIRFCSNTDSLRRNFGFKKIWHQ
jgi:hypothetical protein